MQMADFRMADGEFFSSIISNKGNMELIKRFRIEASAIRHSPFAIRT
jgi:hypothetical protein